MLECEAVRGQLAGAAFLHSGPGDLTHGVRLGGQSLTPWAILSWQHWVCVQTETRSVASSPSKVQNQAWWYTHVIPALGK